jgi:putative heme iron utilization protein
MDSQLAIHLANIIRNSRQASLGTIHNGAPFVSMVLVVPSADLSNYYIHISRLAQHTRDIESDPRVSLMFMQKDENIADPQQLARVSLVGRAFRVSSGDADVSQAQALYLQRYPASESYFTFADFYMYRIKAEGGRFVAGFAKAVNLKVEDLRQASQE